MPLREHLNVILGIGGTMLCFALIVGFAHRPSATQARLEALRSGAANAEGVTGSIKFTPIADLIPASFTRGDTARDQELLALAARPDILALGAMVFEGYCTVCHGTKVETEAGERSKLFDPIWYHGATPAEIEHATRIGYPLTGMMGWEELIPEEQLTAVVAYLISKQIEPGE